MTMIALRRYGILVAVVIALAMTASTIMVLNAVTCSNYSFGSKSLVYVEAYISSDGRDGYVMTEVDKIDSKTLYFLKIRFIAWANHARFADYEIILDPAIDGIALIKDKPVGQHFSVSVYTGTWWSTNPSVEPWRADASAGVKAFRNGFCAYEVPNLFMG